MRADNRRTLTGTEAQTALGPLVADLRSWDGRLADLIDRIEPGDEIADDVILTAGAVRREQIAEAVDILSALEIVGADEPLPPFRRQLDAADAARDAFDPRAVIVFSLRRLPVCYYCRRDTPDRPGPIGYRVGRGPVCDRCFSARHPDLAILLVGIMTLRVGGRTGFGRWLRTAGDLLALGKYLETRLAHVWPIRFIDFIRLPAPRSRQGGDDGPA